MHPLFLLTTVLSSLSLAPEASVPAHLEERPALRLPSSRSGELHLLDPKLGEHSDEEGSIGHVFIEGLAGVGVGAVLDVLGYFALSRPPKLFEWVIPMALNVLGTSAGVTFTGWALNRRGSSTHALLGSLVGYLVPVAMATIVVAANTCDYRSSLKSCRTELVSVGIAGLLAPAIGATVGFELWASKPWLSLDYASRTPPPTPRVVPVLTLARQGLGVTLGIAGRL